MWQIHEMKTKRLPTFQVPEDAYNLFARLAKDLGKPMSQAVREAMQEYAARHGVDIDFDIPQWGGNRRTDQDENDPQ